MTKTIVILIFLGAVLFSLSGCGACNESNRRADGSYPARCSDVF